MTPLSSTELSGTGLWGLETPVNFLAVPVAKVRPVVQLGTAWLGGVWSSLNSRGLSLLQADHGGISSL